MFRHIVIILFALLGMSFLATSVMAQIDCSPLDPRASVSKEVDGRVKATVNTLFKILKAGGAVEGKVKEEVRNLQKGVPISERGLIKLRTLYLFCGMVANAKDISTVRKVELFNIMMNEKETNLNKGEERRSAGKKKKKASNKNRTVPPRSPLTLHDFYKNDFSNLMKISDTATLTFKNGPTLKIGYQLYLDFDGGSEFMGFYIPKSPRTEEICAKIPGWIKTMLQRLQHNTVAIDQKDPGQAGITPELKDLKFSGRIFVYHQTPIFDSAIDDLKSLYKAKGFFPEFRGPDYVYQKTKLLGTIH